MRFYHLELPHMLRASPEPVAEYNAGKKAGRRGSRKEGQESLKNARGKAAGAQWLAARLGQALNQLCHGRSSLLPCPPPTPPPLHPTHPRPRAPGAEKQRETARSTTLGVGHMPPALLWGRLLPPAHRESLSGGVRAQEQKKPQFQPTSETYAASEDRQKDCGSLARCDRGLEP